MVFNNTTDLNGAIQFCELRTGLGNGGISGNATLLKQFTTLINEGSSKVWHIIFAMRGGWKYDDANNTDLPQASQSLTAGISKYALPTDALTVNRIEVLDANGIYQKLEPIRIEGIDGAVDEFLKTDGLPRYYRLIGNTIEVFPAPSATAVTLTSGIKVYFDRGSVAFVSTDTTKTFGFASEYHDIPPRKAVIEWMKIFKPESPSLGQFISDDITRVAQLEEYEARKWEDVKPTLRTRQINYR